MAKNQSFFSEISYVENVANFCKMQLSALRTHIHKLDWTLGHQFDIPAVANLWSHISSKCTKIPI